MSRIKINKVGEKELQEILFEEFTAILAKHNISLRAAQSLTGMFPARWYRLQERVLEPIEVCLHKISPSIFFEKEEEIKQICLRTAEEIHLLIERGAGASDQGVQP